MKDKVVLITGGTGGIGLATAEGLARLGARLVIVGRSRDAGALATAQLLRSGAAAAEFIEADLSSQTSVHRLANEVLAKYDRLDVLLNNAGAFFPKRQETEDQLEATLAVNHLAPFLLTHLVLPLLKQTEASRIINVNSDAHRLAKPPLDNDPQWRQRYSAVKAYANAKLLNLLCTYEWSRFLAGTSITVNALHPGVALTSLTRGTPKFFQWYLQLTRWRTTVERAAETSIYLASSGDVAGITGRHFAKRRAVDSSKWSYDRVLAVNAWDLGLNLTGTVRGGKSIGAVTVPPGLSH